jgi:tRNA dimethylallyltransferase
MERKKKLKLIVVIGPTASGKTGLSIALAKKYDGEVISADSRQVYRELNIGTEKVTKKEMQGIPHYCIDVANPKRTYTVEQWRREAEKAIVSMRKRNKLPIVAGGTAFYVDSLVYGTSFPSVKPNRQLRKALEKKTVEELLLQLKKLDPKRAKTIEQKNPRRLIRAIEIATELGTVPPLPKQKPLYEVTWIGLNPGLPILVERITARLGSTFKKGLVAETKKMREELGLSWKRINEIGLEYRIVGEYLRKEISKEEMQEKMIRELRSYAKRQMTWLKRNENIQWFASAEEALTSLDISTI